MPEALYIRPPSCTSAIVYTYIYAVRRALALARASPRSPPCVRICAPLVELSLSSPLQRVRRFSTSSQAQSPVDAAPGSVVSPVAPLANLRKSERERETVDTGRHWHRGERERECECFKPCVTHKRFHPRECEKQRERGGGGRLGCRTARDMLLSAGGRCSSPRRCRRSCRWPLDEASAELATVAAAAWPASASATTPISPAICYWSD